MTLANLQEAGLATRRRRTTLRNRVELPDAPGVRTASMAALADVLEENDRALAKLPVWTTFGWVKYLTDGHKRVLLRHAGVFSEFRTIGVLTDRQRGLLCHALRSPSLLHEKAA